MTDYRDWLAARGYHRATVVRTEVKEGDVVINPLNKPLLKPRTEKV